jgi:cyanuric acid amidohydrolase
MAIEVAKVELKSVSDAGGMDERIKAGQFTADQVIAVIGKTEGNGGVNDFTRILADQAFRRVLMKHGKRSEGDVGKIPMVWSGGCDGVITPLPRCSPARQEGQSRVEIAGLPSAPRSAAPGARNRAADAVARGPRGCGASGDAQSRHQQSRGCALRTDQDAAAHD